MTLQVKIASCSWSTGVLEYWSVGKSQSPNFKVNESFHYSITPVARRKRGETTVTTSFGSLQVVTVWQPTLPGS
jgi:hypothetical protein